MPRPPVAAVARLERISVRATEDEIATLDRMRGHQTRSDFIRRLIQERSGRRAAKSLEEKQ